MDYEAELRAEFYDELEQALDEIEGQLLGASGSAPASSTENKGGMRALARDIDLLRYKGRSLELTAVDTVLYRFHDYLHDVEAPSEAQLSDFQTFVEVLRDFAEKREDHAPASIPELVRSLPSRYIADVDDVMSLLVEILVVVPQRTALRWLERELTACGYRFFGARTSFDAIDLAVRMKPDMIMVSGLIDELSGVDLACAFNAMPTTRKIPVCLLTSDDERPADLPEDTLVLKKSANFGEHFADALESYGIA